MNNLNERIGHVLVAIPLAHILGSALFLWSYCTGFGSHLASHASAADLISVSISDMVLAYIVSLVLPAVTLGARLSLKHPYAMDYANSLTDDQTRDVAKRAVLRGRRLMFWTILSLAIVACGFGAYKITTGYPPPFLLFYLGAFPALIYGFMTYSEKLGFTSYQFEIAAILLSFILALIFTGLDKGQTDRFRYHETSKAKYTRCKEALVLRQLSGNYLAILPDDSKAIISNECKVVFIIPAPGKMNPLGPPPHTRPVTPRR